MINSEHIRKYLDGKLSPQEMQAIEKAALDDPFLADAIDGITESRNHPVPFEAAVSDLQKKLAERVLQKERKKAIPWIAGQWRAAASVFLVVTIAAVTITLINRNSQKPAIAIRNNSDSLKHQPSITPPAIQTDSGDAIANSAKSARANYTKPVMNRDRSRPGQKKSNPAAEETDERGRSSASRQAVASAPVAIVESEKPVADKKDTPDYTMPEKDRLSAAPPVQDGLKSKAAIPDEESGDATIKSHLETAGKPAENKKVEPLMGWEAFNEFVSRNKNIQTSDSLLKGVEIISFIVDQKGNLSSFKIVQSVSPAHDTHLIQLVRSVQWKIIKGKKQKRMITVEYP